MCLLENSREYRLFIRVTALGTELTWSLWNPFAALLSRHQKKIKKNKNKNLSADLGCQRNISIHAYPCTFTNECTYWGNKRHTGVVLVSRCDCHSSLLLSPHFLQTTSAYTPDLERLPVWFLCVSQIEPYGCKLRWAPHGLDTGLDSSSVRMYTALSSRGERLQVLLFGILSPHIYSLTLRLRRGGVRPTWRLSDMLLAQRSLLSAWISWI